MKNVLFLKSSHLLIMLVSFLATLTSLGCDKKTEYTSQTKQQWENYEIYRFPTRDVSGFKELITGDPISNDEGAGYLYLPREASRINRVPLMIILHGSGGIWRAEERDMLSF